MHSSQYTTASCLTEIFLLRKVHENNGINKTLETKTLTAMKSQQREACMD